MSELSMRVVGTFSMLISILQIGRSMESSVGCLGKKNFDENMAKVFVLREHEADGVQVLLKLASSSTGSEKSSSRPSKVKLVVENDYLIPSLDTSKEYLARISEILNGHQFSLPVIVPTSILEANKFCLIIGDEGGFHDTRPIKGYEWASFEKALNGKLRLDASINGEKVDWNSIFKTLKIDKTSSFTSDEDSTGSDSPRASFKISRQSPATESPKRCYTLVLTRLGPNGTPEVLLERSRRAKGLILPEIHTAKHSDIQSEIGIKLESKSPIVKKKLSAVQKVVLICRADWSTDGHLSTSLSHDNHLYTWKALQPAPDTSNPLGHLKKSSSTDRLDIYTNELLDSLDKQCGGPDGWRKIFKVLHTDKKTKCHTLDNHHHHHHHVSIHHPHMPHLYLSNHHPNLHQHNHHQQAHHHLDEGKQYLVAVWNGTFEYLREPTSPRSKLKAISFDFYAKMMERERTYKKDHLTPFTILKTKDALQVFTFPLQKILVCTMVDLADWDFLARNGVRTATAEFIRRTNVVAAKFKLDQVEKPTGREVVYVENISIIRKDAKEGYKFSESKFKHLGVVILDKLHHEHGASLKGSKESECKHGRLSQECMRLLVSKLCNAFIIADGEEYDAIVFPFGRHEWEGVHYKCFLAALHQASSIAQKRLKLKKLDKIILAIEPGYTEEEVEFIKEELGCGSSTEL